MKRVFALFVILGVFGILALSGSVDGAGHRMSTGGVLKFTERKSAPNFTLENLEGEQVALKDFRGKVVFLNFWTTW